MDNCIETTPKITYNLLASLEKNLDLQKARTSPCKEKKIMRKSWCYQITGSIPE